MRNFMSENSDSVLCRVLNHRDLPLILFGTCIDNPDQSGSYAPDNVISWAGLHNARMADNFAKALKSQLLLLRLRETHMGFAASFRINKCLRSKIDPTDGNSRKKYREETEGTLHRPKD